MNTTTLPDGIYSSLSVIALISMCVSLLLIVATLISYFRKKQDKAKIFFNLLGISLAVFILIVIVISMFDKEKPSFQNTTTLPDIIYSMLCILGLIGTCGFMGVLFVKIKCFIERKEQEFSIVRWILFNSSIFFIVLYSPLESIFSKSNKDIINDTSSLLNSPHLIKTILISILVFFWICLLTKIMVLHFVKKESISNNIYDKLLVTCAAFISIIQYFF